MTLVLLLQTLITGLMQGGIYALIAVGLMLALGVLGIVNFAHGEFLMIAMYITLLVAGFDINPYLAVIVSLPILYFTGVFLAKYLLLPIIDREPTAQFLIMIGLSMVLMNLALVIFSPNVYTVEGMLSGKNLDFGGVFINSERLVGFIVSMLATGLLFWLMQKTHLGRCIRAVSQNRTAAALVGINVKSIYQIAFGISIGVLGIAGPFLAPVYFVTPDVGSFFILLAFAIVIVGGMDNFKGAIIAAFIIGIAEAFGSILIPGISGPILPFLILLLTLLFRPQGLLGRA